MRHRDVKLHWFLVILIFGIVGVFNLFYVNSYATKVDELAHNDALAQATVSLSQMSDKIAVYEAEIGHGVYELDGVELELIENPVSNYKDFFVHERGTSIKTRREMEGLDDDSYCFYILHKHIVEGVEESFVIRTDLVNVMPTLEGSDSRSMIVLKENTSIIYNSNPGASSLSTYSGTASEMIRENLDAGLTEFSVSTDYEGKEYFISMVSIGADYLYVEMVDGAPFMEPLKQLQIFSIMFTIVVGLALILTVVISIKMIQKQSKIVTISRKAASRPDSFLIRTDSKGKILYLYHKMKVFDKHKEILERPFDFINLDGTPLSECLKRESNQICVFEIEEKKIYLNVMIYPYNGTFYFIGTNNTQYQEQFERLKDLNSKNLITMLPNFYSLSGDFAQIKKDGFNSITTFGMMNMVESYDLEKLFGTDLLNKLIKEATQRVKDNLPATARMYHISKASCVIIFNSQSKEENHRNFEVVQSAVREAYHINKNTILTKIKCASHDVLNTTSEDVTLDDLMFKLNITMDEAIESKTRDYVKYDINIQNDHDHKMQMQEDLATAVEKGEFVMYYQPQVNLETNKITGFEALIRWNNPKYQKTSPQVYIELAEKSGHIIDIGNFVIKDVFKAAKIMEEHDVHISINVSPAQLFQAGFTTNLLEEFERNELKVGSIAIEITETFLMENFKLIVDKLNILKNRGFSIHLDDFGTGYSSMLYLKQLPIDTIKTDREFIKSISGDASSQSIVNCIVNLAKSLDLKVVSEGVETEDQKKILKNMKVDTIQGYLISKPVVFDEALNLVLEYNSKKKGRA